MRLQQNLAPWERLISVAIGAALVGGAVRRHRALSRTTATGLGLLARGVAGYCPVSATLGIGSWHGDTREALAGSRGYRLSESIIIARSPEDVFAFWSDFDNLPRFIKGLQPIEPIDATTTRWTWSGPGGIRFQWDAETINEIAPVLIAWRSLPGADIVSAGSVHFTPAGSSDTKVTVTMQHTIPAGHAGAAAGWLIGRAPASELRADLRQLKILLETGEDLSMEREPEDLRTALFRTAD